MFFIFSTFLFPTEFFEILRNVESFIMRIKAVFRIFSKIISLEGEFGDDLFDFSLFLFLNSVHLLELMTFLFLGKFLGNTEIMIIRTE